MDRIPILRMGSYLLVTVQVDMHDELAVRLLVPTEHDLAGGERRGGDDEQVEPEALPRVPREFDHERTLARTGAGRIGRANDARIVLEEESESEIRPTPRELRRETIAA